MLEKRVNWQYEHSLNSHSRVMRVKTGVYYGKIKHTVKHWRKNDAEQMACVKFDGNKQCSYVPYNELEFIK
jgi:hypothetical protein